MGAKQLLVVAAIAGGLTAAVWYALKEPPKPRGSDLGRALPDAGAAPGVTDDGLPDARARDGELVLEDEQRGADAAEQRVEAIPARRAGRVVDPMGQPVSGVLVTWSAPSEGELGELALARSRAALHEIRATTDGAGRFAFDSAPPGAGERPSVLWASAEGFRAAHRIMGIGEDPAGDEPFVLEPSGGLDVEVVDAEGTPVEGALVSAALADDQAHPAGAALAPLARSSLLRQAETDANGRCTIPAFPGEPLVVARAGSRATAPWIGTAPREIRLTLLSTLTAGGQVHLDGPNLDASSMVVDVQAVSAGLRRVLGEARVEPSGVWGPLTLPAIADGELVFRLAGGGAVPLQASREPAEPGSHMTVDFQASPGVPLEVVVQNDLEEPIPLAAVEAWWRIGQDWCAARARTNPEGLARLDAIPLGDVVLRARAPGHAEQTTAAIPVPEPPAHAYLVELPRAGRIEGRVLAGDEPADTFRIFYVEQATYQHRTLTVANERSGRFEIPGAPLGEVALTAVAEGFAPSRWETVEVPAEGPVTVELSLSPPRRGRGRVVDALSGRPVQGAVVRSWHRQGDRLLAPTGFEAVASSDGRFVLEGLRPMHEHIEIRSTGYATQWAGVAVGELEELDLGDWPLAPAQTLLVRMKAPHLDPEDCRASLVDREEGSWRAFDSAGEAVFAGVSGGPLTVRIELPDGTLVHDTAFMASGRPWIVDVELRDPDGSALDVLVRGDASPGEKLRVRAMVTSPGGERFHERFVPVQDGRCRIPGPFGDEVILELQDFQGIGLSLRHVTAAELRHGRVELDALGKHLIFRVMDEKRLPVPRVLAMLALPDDRTRWRSWGPTDGEGRVRLLVPDGVPLLLHLRLADGGGMADIAVAPDARAGDEIEVVLPAMVSFDVRFSDAGVPIQGVNASLLAPSGFRFAYLSTSDHLGRAACGPVPPGSYALEVTHHGVWPMGFPLNAGPEPREHELPLRRLGALLLRARYAEGPAVAAAAVHLESVEFGESVEHWIAEGRVQPPAGGMSTDEDGRVRLLAIPNGTYRYRIASGDGRVAEGELLVPPHAEGDVKIVLH